MFKSQSFRLLSRNVHFSLAPKRPKSLGMTQEPSFSKLVPVIGRPGDDRVGRRIQLRHFESRENAKVSVLFVPGFMSHGLGTKATFLAGECFEKGFNYYCYDPEGIGESPGDLSRCEAADWFEDCETALDFICQDRPEDAIIVVGSSIGAWIGLKSYPRFSLSVVGFLLLAPALNVLWPKYEGIYDELDEKAKEKVDSGETILIDSEYGKLPIRKNFFLNSRKLEFDLKKPIEVKCPIRIIHGMRDDVIPFESSSKLLQNVTTNDVDVIFRKHGDHRLSSPDDLKLLSNVLVWLKSEITQ